MAKSKDTGFHPHESFEFPDYENFITAKVKIKHGIYKHCGKKVLHLLHFLRQTFILHIVGIH